MINRKLYRTAVVLSTLALVACGGPEEEPGAAVQTEAAVEPAGAMGDMQGMQGMESMQQGGVAARLQGHMKMMEGASGEQIKAMVPEHRQIVANMIAQMNQEMRGMDMADNTEWNSTVAALREDLVRLPEMTAEEIKTFLPEHQTRIDRLVEMHGEMMSKMKM